MTICKKLIFQLVVLAKLAAGGASVPFGQPAFRRTSDVTARISNDVMAHLLVIIPSQR